MKNNEDKAKVAFYEVEAREFVKAHPDYEPNPQKPRQNYRPFEGEESRS